MPVDSFGSAAARDVDGRGACASFPHSGAVVLVAFPFGIYFLAQGLFSSFKNNRLAEAVAVQLAAVVRHSPQSVRSTTLNQ